MTVTVNGETIGEDAIQAEANRLRPDYERHLKEHGETPDEPQLLAWCRENLVERTLLRQEAARRVEAVAPERLEQAFTQAREGAPESMSDDTLRAEITLDMKVQALVEEVQAGAAAPTDDDVRAFYDANPAMFESPERVRARHIVRHPNQSEDRTVAYLAMVNMLEQLRKGTPFETLAGEGSDCPDNGGDLGYFARGQMVKAFEDVVFALEPGQISEVFETEFGYHIARLDERIPGGPAPFEEVRGHITEQLDRETKNHAIEAFVDELKTVATITGL